MATIDVKHVIYWGVAALALFALAAPAPDIATILVLILITGVVLSHASDYIALIQGASPVSPAAPVVGGNPIRRS